MRRLVEAELLLELLDELRVEPLRAAVLRAGVAAALADCAWLPPAKPSPWPPPMRAVAETSVPVSCAITRSTGPPGANWMMAKLISMIPNSVGMISSMRFRR